MKILRSLALVLIFILISNIGYGQSLVKTFSGEYRLAGADPLGNFYLVNDTRIIKTDSTGNELFSYADPESGNISHIDVSDPFRTLVYYKDYNQLNVLDRTLSPLGEPIGFDEIDIYKPIGIAKSSLGGFWVIDSPTSSLIFIDHKLTPVMSIKISGINNDEPDPWYPLAEWKKRLYLCIPGKQIRLFDLFGTQLKTISSSARAFSSYNGKLLLTEPGKMHYLDSMPGITPDLPELDLSGWEELHISGNHALVKQQSTWSLYRLKKTF